MNGERQWDDFLNTFADDRDASDYKEHYIRINPDFDHDPPALDDAKKIPLLQAHTARYLAAKEGRGLIANVVHRLLASCFYYERLPRARYKSSDYSYTLNGKSSLLL